MKVKQQSIQQQLKSANKDLKLARLIVNSLEFGTTEWEYAMESVRVLCEKVNSLTDFGDYTSIDGDVFQKH